MSLDLDDTIVAIASAPSGALRGIVRLSGPASAACVGSVFRAVTSTGSDVFGGQHRSITEHQQLPKSPETLIVQSPSLLVGQLTLPGELGVVPARLYLWPNDRSYTRQPSAELHTIGSPPLLETVVESLCQAGARLARPGEFTLRAFLAGRLDLTQAEAVLGVIDARGQVQLDTALAQLAGGLASPLAALRERLLELLAHLEAGLDFVDEDIEFITTAELEAQLSAAAHEVQRLADRVHWRRDTIELPRIVLVGPPNAGKSSLFNALAGADAAIVASTAGTTRDYVTYRMAAEGQEFLLVDTAGQSEINHADGGHDAPLVALSQAFTERQKRDADVAIVCRETHRNPVGAFRFAHAPYASDASTILVWTKCDVAAPPADQPGLATSSANGAGIAELKRAIAARLCERSADTVVGNTAARCGESLHLAAAALARARDLATTGTGDELVAAEVRMALDGLAQVAGAVYTDDVLDRVFSKFCIGK
jgi:tRNA modification GTPase